ncbi:MAG: sulfatase-like hydrolase/transferase [Trueperaceae bacterium]|nr:sulfatase-like hydrolase/transferase [Trueperaceae bacterium]MCW5818815.1 sulfatase-like hydrolase/transferase [Trueperaceae bacterium]
MTPKRPNLLLVITDQQRADTVMPGGPCLTPNLQRLAAEGARFERCYAANPICSPSRASLFTGHLPHSHGVTDVTHAVPAPEAELRPGMPFWSRELARAGYRTGYFGKWHVERTERLEEYGFQEYETELRLVGVQEHRGELARSLRVSQPGYRDLLVAGVTEARADQTREHALIGRGVEFIERARPGEPWALVVSTEAPHDPYIAPREYFERYDPAAIPEPPSFADPMTDKPAIYRRIREAWWGLAWDDFAFATACYRALCSMLDDQVGRLLAALDATGQAEDTLVVFTSDHGDYLGAHGLLFKGVPAFEEAYRVPLVMRGPGVAAGVSVSGPVSLLDLPRTLVRLLLGEEFDCQGGELTGWLTGEGVPASAAPGATASAPVVLASGAGAGAPGEAFAEFHGQRFRYTQRVLWRGDWKYVMNGFDQDELYDLANDPHELRNLAGDPSKRPVLEDMARRMWRWVKDTGDETLAEAHYGMFRFLPVGPDAG